METFPTLEQFLQLRDPYDRYGCSAFPKATGMLGWRKGLHPFEIAYKVYLQAKASWETYGDAGPPVGTIVQMLASGHGGPAGVIRAFDGVYERDPRFFQVSTSGGGYYSGVSSVSREHWWIHLRVYVADDEFEQLMF